MHRRSNAAGLSPRAGVSADVDERLVHADAQAAAVDAGAAGCRRRHEGWADPELDPGGAAGRRARGRKLHLHETAARATPAGCAPGVRRLPVLPLPAARRAPGPAFRPAAVAGPLPSTGWETPGRPPRRSTASARRGRRSARIPGHTTRTRRSGDCARRLPLSSAVPRGRTVVRDAPRPAAGAHPAADSTGRPRWWPPPRTRPRVSPACGCRTPSGRAASRSTERADRDHPPTATARRHPGSGRIRDSRGRAA